MEFDLENPFSIFDGGDSLSSDVASLLEVESDHLLSETYVKSLKLGDSDFIVRREAVSSISQAEGGLIFDAKTIQRMEVLILGALKWRMRSITPFSFLCFFIPLFSLEDPASRQALKARASEIIFKAQNDVKLLEFKPSDIAASAVLSACHDLFPLQFPGYRETIFGCSFVNKEAMEGNDSVVDVVSSSETPINVLDFQPSASESGATTGRQLPGWRKRQA